MYLSCKKIMQEVCKNGTSEVVEVKDYGIFLGWFDLDDPKVVSS